MGFVSSIFGGGPKVEAPPPPPPPPPAPTPPTVATGSAGSAGAAARSAAAAAAGLGFDQTLLTGPQGAQTPATAKKELTGAMVLLSFALTAIASGVC